MNDFDYDIWLSSPPEDEAIAKDWKGDNLFDGDLVFKTTDGEYISEDKIREYIIQQFGIPEELRASNL